MRAYVLKDNKPTFSFEDVNLPVLKKDEVIVNLDAAAMNHRDVWISKGMYAGLKYPIILGSDGAGWLDGEEVIINPGQGWGENGSFHGKDFKILGLPENGTFAQQVITDKKYVYPKPGHLTMEQAAALPLAGLTAYRALFSRGRLQRGDKLLISGIGGGVALMTLKLGVAAGAEVFVTSSDSEIIDKAIEIGARGGFLYTEDNWSKPAYKETGGIDLIIDGAGGKGFSELINVCNTGGRIVNYGGSAGMIEGIVPQKVFWKHLSILGSTMGSDSDFEQMITFVNRYEIIPVIDTVFELGVADQGFERMESGRQFGKIVFSIPSII